MFKLRAVPLCRMNNSGKVRAHHPPPQKALVRTLNCSLSNSSGSDQEFVEAEFVEAMFMEAMFQSNRLLQSVIYYQRGFIELLDFLWKILDTIHQQFQPLLKEDVEIWNTIVQYNLKKFPLYIVKTLYSIWERSSWPLKQSKLQWNSYRLQINSTCRPSLLRGNSFVYWAAIQTDQWSSHKLVDLPEMLNGNITDSLIKLIRRDRQPPSNHNKGTFSSLPVDMQICYNIKSILHLYFYRIWM